MLWKVIRKTFTERTLDEIGEVWWRRTKQEIIKLKKDLTDNESSE